MTEGAGRLDRNVPQDLWPYSRLIRSIKLAGYVLAFIVTTLLANLFPASRRRRAISRVVSYFSARGLQTVGIRTTGTARVPSGGSLVVANHLSYLDILVMASFFPAVFVTSLDLGKESIIGSICRIAGCVFVNRRSPFGLQKEIAEIARLINEGHTVVIFPEATTSDGRGVAQFRSALLEAAGQAQAPIQPLCFNYRDVDGEPLSAENRDRMFYYGGMTFFPHVFRLTAITSATVEVTPLPPVMPGTRNRKDAARTVEDAIRAAYRPIP